MKKDVKNATARAKKVPIAKGIKVSKEKKVKMEKKPGGSNVGKYSSVAKKKFCGPSGGAPEGSYPVNTKKRAKAALSYAHNAPNPSGIKACVRRMFKSLGKKKK